MCGGGDGGGGVCVGDRGGAVAISICNRDPLREKWITFFTSFFGKGDFIVDFIYSYIFLFILVSLWKYFSFQTI